MFSETIFYSILHRTSDLIGSLKRDMIILILIVANFFFLMYLSGRYFLKITSIRSVKLVSCLQLPYHNCPKSNFCQLNVIHLIFTLVYYRWNFLSPPPPFPIWCRKKYKLFFFNSTFCNFWSRHSAGSRRTT